MSQGVLGGEFDRIEQAEVKTKVKEAEDAAKDEIWGGYRHAVLADSKEPDGLRTIDLGAGHSSARETLCGRVVAALKTEALLNETISVGYLGRQWPPAFKDSGAWPLTSLRQSFLDESLTRLRDPDTTLREKIVEFVRTGSFGLGSGPNDDGGYERLWYAEDMTSEEVAFDEAVFLVKKEKAEALRAPPVDDTPPTPLPEPPPQPDTPPRGASEKPPSGKEASTANIQINGSVPSESWNRLGTKVIAKLRSGTDLKIEVQCSVQVSANAADNLESEIKQALNDLGLQAVLQVKRT